MYHLCCHQRFLVVAVDGTEQWTVAGSIGNADLCTIVDGIEVAFHRTVACTIFVAISGSLVVAVDGTAQWTVAGSMRLPLYHR